MNITKHVCLSQCITLRMSNAWSHWQRNVFGSKRKRQRSFEGADNEYVQSTEKLYCSTSYSKSYAALSSKQSCDCHHGFEVNQQSVAKSDNPEGTFVSQNQAAVRSAFKTAAVLAKLPISDIATLSKETQHPQKRDSISTQCSDADSIDIGVFKSLLESNKDITEAHIRRIMSTARLPCTTNGVKEDDIGGLLEVKKIVKDRIIRPLKRPEIHKGLYKASSGILFFGPPGTGKTTLAKWIADESCATFFSVSPSCVMSMYMGETETLVKCLFKCAELLSPSIIFLDEVDAFIAKRGEKQEESTLRMKNQLLQCMDGMNTQSDRDLIVIAATNRPEALDEAALRRLPKRIYIALPDKLAIEQQIRLLLKKHASALGQDCDNQNYDWLPHYAGKLSGFNGSDLKALCVKAAEIVYDQVLYRYNGNLDAIPNASAFTLPGQAEFEAALAKVSPSSNTTSTEAYFLWSQQLGCL